jgi:hypothetical protein
MTWTYPPVIRSHHGNGFIKQHVRDHRILRSPFSANVFQRSPTTTSLCNRTSSRPSSTAASCEFTAAGKRIPGLKLDNPRQLAVRFAHIAAGSTFTPAEIHTHVIDALRCPPERYTLAALRYDLSKLRANFKLPRSRRYRLMPQGYSICLIFLKLFERIYAPLTAGLLSPIRGDARLQAKHRSQLDRQRVVDDLDELVRAVGLKAT